MMESPMLSGSCRCCASEGAYKDVKSSYHWMGEEEIYADMLKDCFDISLSSPSDGQEEGGICEICITQLRNAANFRKQVLHTEEQFKNRLQIGIFKPELVKVEIPGEDENDSDDNNASADEVYSGPEFEVPIKSESPEEPKPKKRAAKKATTTRAKKAKTDDAETSTKRSHSRKSEGRIMNTSPITCDDDEENLSVITLDKKTNFSSFITIRPVGQRTLPEVRERQRRVWQQKRLSELDLHIDNIKAILKYSNATPIRCRVGDRYACSFCLDQYQNLADLKNHTLETHSDDKPEFFHHKQSLSRLLVILDVTAVKCNLCDTDIVSLKQLMDHLKKTHDELIHTQIKNQIVPVKLTGDRLTCAVCSNVIEDINSIHDHMSEHYKNYVCEFCNEAFVIRCKMAEHKNIVHRV